MPDALLPAVAVAAGRNDLIGAGPLVVGIVAPAGCAALEAGESVIARSDKATATAPKRADRVRRPAELVRITVFFTMTFPITHKNGTFSGQFALNWA